MLRILKDLLPRGLSGGVRRQPCILSFIECKEWLETKCNCPTGYIPGREHESLAASTTPRLPSSSAASTKALEPK